MWTLATLMSAQLRDMTDPLYHETKKRLGPLTIEGNEHSSHDTELVQSWVLIATCESMRTFHREAWMSGGRAFRLVQGLRYHEIDSDCVPGVLTSLGEDAPVMTEERRRVFWMAYFLDHILGIRNDWPLTLCDEMVRPRVHLIYAFKGSLHTHSQLTDSYPAPSSGYRLSELPGRGWALLAGGHGKA